jgi:hypothetical protein
MFSEIALDFLDIIGLIVMIGIAISFGLASFWHIKFLQLSKWQQYSWIKAYTMIICIMICILYIYTIIEFIIGTPIEVSIFGFAFVRPALLLLGGALASGARARCISLLSGGENWRLRHKIL